MIEDIKKIAKIGIVTTSDRASAGIYEDLSGKAIIDTLNGYLKSPWQEVYRCISDDRTTIEETLIDLIDNQKCCLVVQQEEQDLLLEM